MEQRKEALFDKQMINLLKLLFKDDQLISLLSRRTEKNLKNISSFLVRGVDF